MGREALDVIEAEAATDGSRSGWALCQLKGSSYLPIKAGEGKKSACYVEGNYNEIIKTMGVSLHLSKNVVN